MKALRTIPPLTFVMLFAPLTTAGIIFNSDAEFNAYGFEKVAGVNVRWGNGALGGDWEFSIVDASDNPKDQQNFVWSSSGGNPHSLAISTGLDPASSQEIGAMITTESSLAFSQWSLPLGDLNALFFRVRSDDGRGAAGLSGISIVFSDATTIDLGDLNDVANGARYLGIVDQRIAGGFEVNATGSLSSIDSGAGGSLPAYQVKLGRVDAPVPAPATVALLGLGLLGLRLRRKA